MDYSPKLKKVAEQIKRVLKENDVAGYVVLHTPGHAEYITELKPSYSCIEYTPTGVQFKSATKHHASKADRDAKLRDTINMVRLLADTTGNGALMLLQLAETADKAFNATHTDGKFTGQNEIDN
ncbi:MAG TPA: hypothetical protein VEY71_05365 [Chitinophagales bacterium]|nr:hypothetical protein [Chitinophagales bacterium]